MPKLECDLIMQGGLTSGVVYPNTIVQLSTQYRFRNIGGASAGAIAAGAAAAAEYARQTGSTRKGSGMAGVAALPGEFARGGVLKYFQPDPKLARLFGVLTDALDAKGSKSAALYSLFRRYVRPRISLPAVVLIGITVLLAVALVYLVVKVFCAASVGDFSPGSMMPPLALAGSVLGIFGLAVIATLSTMGLGLYRATSDLATDITKTVPDKGFGICSGLTMSGHSKNSGLTDWLYGLFQELAGKNETDDPLTFRDLSEKGINLEVITTCLSQGRPHRLPMDTAIFWFDEEEFKELFPKQVVAQLTSVAQRENAKLKPADRKQLPVLGTGKQEGMRFWPFPGNHAKAGQPDTALDLPIIVAIRMSLSFPLLFKAIPLYMIDRSGRGIADETGRDETHKPIRHAEHDAAKDAEAPMLKCWFSDGGISSNFPMHFFDSMMPQRPTFGIALGEITTEQQKSGKKSTVWRPVKPGQGQLSTWRELSGLGGLLGSILSSAKDWQDNMLAEIPGYRERIVTVNLLPDQGGMNLNMDGKKIASLSKLGQAAGADLLQFDFDEHRWRRFLVAQDRLRRLIEGVSGSWTHTGPFISRYQPQSYKANMPNLPNVIVQINDMAAMPTDPTNWPLLDVPKPSCVLRISPKE
ncbi:MAG: patatin-like phospholipase family protein [Sphingobium sp.]|jgi:predicted acylesterase/phospholipase RssA|nr:patatin-like phospholipase family protein [Sphingobium sp.]